jgi:outer membrane receptor protein involved in Fe transport
MIFSVRPTNRASQEKPPIWPDQIGFNANLPGQSFASMNMYFARKSFGEKYSIAVNGLNVGNRRVPLDNSLTFGGFHYNDPREIYAEFRYRFHY